MPPHVTMVSGILDKMGTPFLEHIGRCPSEFSDRQLADLTAYLMSPNGDYNCADVRSELYLPTNDADGEPFLSDCQPDGWAKLRCKLWEQLYHTDLPHHCYLISGKNDVVYLLRGFLLFDLI